MSFRIEQAHTAVGRHAPGVAEVARVLSPGRCPCLVMVSAGSCGWSVCDNIATGKLLGSFEWCWRRAEREIRPHWRLRCSVKGAIRRHHSRIDLAAIEDPELVGLPWVTVAAVHLSGDRAHCAWVGGDEITVWSGEQAVWSNHPPSLRSLLGAVHPGERPQLMSAEVRLEPGMHITLVNRQWPKRCPAEEIQRLWKGSERARVDWCKQYRREYLSLLSCSLA